MHPFVRPAGCGNLRSFPCNAGNRRLDAVLKRAAERLALPAMESAAIVFEPYCDSHSIMTDAAASIAAAQGVVGGALRAAENGLAAAQGAFGASAGASTATRALQAMGTASLSLAALGGAAAYLGRAAGNASLGAA